MDNFLVAALYKFSHLEKHWQLKPSLLDSCKENGVNGTLILANEGINGTIAGPESGLRAVLRHIRSDPRLMDLEHKESWAKEMPFHRIKVHLKREIVTMGVEGIDPTSSVGTYVAPSDWNALISAPDVLLIDTRNTYETSIGTFEHAHDPKTQNFREFPAWVQENEELLKEKPKIAMFCTGGIRCEKASSYLLEQGYENVFHLKGGILKYLEDMPEKQSLWNGECFVFDERVSVRHGLDQGDYALCHACRFPIDEADMRSPLYTHGVACPHCFHRTTETQKERFAERQKQVNLAALRNEEHLGAQSSAVQNKKRKE